MGPNILYQILLIDDPHPLDGLAAIDEGVGKDQNGLHPDGLAKGGLDGLFEGIGVADTLGDHVFGGTAAVEK